tara:strand:+ start:2266 stop:2850 length:585 start_codon:yes stop_codon:yes gene_type:complete
MTKIFLLLFGIAVFGSSTPKKKYLPYEIIIGSADLIVEGEIMDFSKDQYDFKITEFLKLKGKFMREIKVNMFEEWTCDIRTKPVVKGQKLLLFLKSGPNGEYDIIHGSSGELFLDEVTEYFSYEYNFKDYMDIKNGIRLFSESYDYLGPLYPKYNEKPVFKKLIQNNREKLNLKESEFFGSISKRVAENYIVKK